MDRLKRDIKFIQSHDGGTMVVCYHKIALYNVEYLPEQNKIWLYKFQRRFLRDRPAHLGENQAEKRKGDTVKIPHVSRHTCHRATIFFFARHNTSPLTCHPFSPLFVSLNLFNQK